MLYSDISSYWLYCFIRIVAIDMGYVPVATGEPIAVKAPMEESMV